MGKKPRKKTPEQLTQDYAEFLQQRSKYIDYLYDQDKQFDQYMFFLSTGVFGVTFSFINSVVKTPVPSLSWLLITSWSLIAGCICLSMIAYIINHFQYKKVISDLDEDYSPTVSTKTQIQKSHPAEFLNISNLILLCSGFVFLLVYVGLNLPK